MRGYTKVFANGQYVQSGSSLNRSVGLKPGKGLAKRGKRAKANACPDDQFRKEVKARAAGRCEVCSGPGDHAHHIRTKQAWPQYRHDPRNGAYLCFRDHLEAHGDMKAFQAWAEANLPHYAELCAEVA
ncbi:MAG: hypothetical protein EOP84_30665 [Verrucomicrobiaceae bacterium]|nr:MAG: hypothetical protein EOP84_30665 [Verrucomicrobiaceae bacterium]